METLKGHPLTVERALMRSGLRGAVKDHPLLTFVVLAYALTWVAVIPYALGAFASPMLACGPFLAALVVTAMTGGWQDTRSLVLRMVQWRVGAQWYAFALVPPLGVTLAVVYVNVLLGAPNPTMALLADLPSVVLIFSMMLLFPLGGGFGEELGWRGFAMPRMLSGRSPLTTSLLLGIVVAGWHAPLFVIGAYHPAWLHILMIVTTTVLFTILYLGSNGSVLLAMLFHAMSNAAPEFLIAGRFTGADLERVLVLLLVGFVALAVVAALFAWPQLTRTRSSAAPVPLAPVPSPA